MSHSGPPGQPGPPGFIDTKWTGEHKKALANVFDTMMRSLDQIGPERMLRAISQLREEATQVKALEVDQNDLDSLSQFADDMRQDYPRMCGTLDRLIIAYGENLRTLGDVQAGCDLQRGDSIYRQVLLTTKEPKAITINAQKLEYLPERISYAEVVKLAGQTGHPTVVYCRGSKEKPEGIMCIGETAVPVVPGMIFEVCHTGNA